MRDIFELLRDHFGDDKFTGIEIGSNTGKFARKLMLNFDLATLWCIDPWDIDESKDLPQGVGTPESSWINWKCKLRQWRDKRIFSYRAKSWDAVSRFKNSMFDFVFIDGDHRKAAVSRDLTDWVPKVGIGGLVIGHDWTSDRWSDDVQRGVGHWLSTQRRRPEIRTDCVYMGVQCFWFVR